EGPRTASEDLIPVEAHRGSEMYAPLSLAPRGGPAGAQRRHRGARRRARGGRPPRPGTVVAFFVLVGLIALVRSAGEESLPPRDAVPAMVWMLLCAGALVRYLRDVFVSERIREDVRIGLVVRVEQPPQPDGEFLPRSGLAWRLAGAPASWRHVADASERLRARL